MVQKIKSLMKVPPPLSLDQWAETYRFLSPEASAEPGRYRIERAEYQRGIMQAISDLETSEVVLMLSSQVGKTETLLNTVGYFIHYEPAPMLIVQPTLDMAQSFSKERLANMLRDCPALSDKVKDARTRDSGNTVLHKTFPQGHLTICGANSPASLASRPIRVVLLDEVDRYPPSAGSEGDPVKLALKRSKTFWNSKAVLVSSPTNKGSSRIESAFQETDQRHYLVPCPACGKFQKLEFKQVIFEKEDPQTARYQCKYCDKQFKDAERWEAVRNGKWQATKPFKGKAGFHLNELYSSWSLLSEIVENFLEAKKLPETLKTFVNTTLAETWEDQGEGIEDIEFLKRRENYSKDNLPNEILLLTAGVDVQDNRLECEVVGWGFDEEAWSVEYKIFYGDPSTLEIWMRLDEYLREVFKRRDGLKLQISSAAIDSGGHYTQAVYTFCKGKASRRVCAVKGQAGQGKAIWPKRAGIRNSAKVPLYMVGVDSAKDIIFARLKIEKKGPGYCHFPISADEEYFQQLTAERVVYSYNKGVLVRSYKAYRARNEALDCRVYAYCCFVGLNANLKTIYKKQNEMLKTLGAKEQPTPEPKEEAKEETKEEIKTETNIQKKPLNIQRNNLKNRHDRPRGGFVNSW